VSSTVPGNDPAPAPVTGSPPGAGGTVVAVIGLGAMGLPMTARLAAHLPVVAYDPVEQRLALARAAGARTAASPAEAVAGAGVVVLAVRTLGQVESALFGAGGAAAGLAPGSVVVLTSTVGVPGARRVAERLAGHGAELVDLPVSGGPKRAGDGDLLVLVGGSDTAVAAARPVIDLLASTVAVVGPNPGDGQAMKTVNQLLCGVHIAAAAEALALAKGLGLDPLVALSTLGAGAAESFMLANRGPRIVQCLDGEEPAVLSRLDIFVKDMGIVTDAGRANGVPTPLAAAAEQLYRLAEAAGLASSDDSALARLLSGPPSAGG
jgi:3-hydroxyisobutyrate dehydrogenase